MDINGDGYSDILSGSYSRMDGDMAGLFQVLYGTKEGKFESAQALKGTDDEPLIVPASNDDMLEKICTRPTAADIDGDGDLDLIVGNFAGSFYQFTGLGDGKFEPKPTKFMVDDQPLMVPHHSDPFLVDWDNDGDLDLLSGSERGGVYISINKGSAKKAEFGKMEKLISYKVTQNFNEVVLGDEHIKGPQSSTRIWVDDIDGDGKLDILVGDSTRLAYAAEGLDEAEVTEKLKEWTAKQQQISEKMNEYYAYLEKQSSSESEGDEQSSDEGTSEERQAEMQKVQQEYSEHWAKRAEILREDYTGFVWVYYQK